MSRSTRVIATPGGDMLFSPVLANQLMRGDMVAPHGMVAGRPWRVTRLRRMPTDPTRIELLWATHGEPVTTGRLTCGVNDSVLRAVGATAGGGL